MKKILLLLCLISSVSIGAKGKRIDRPLKGAKNAAQTNCTDTNNESAGAQPNYRILFINTGSIFGPCRYKEIKSDCSGRYGGESLSPCIEYQLLENKLFSIQDEYNEKYDSYMQELQDIKNNLSKGLIAPLEYSKKEAAIYACMKLLGEIRQSIENAIQEDMQKIANDKLKRVVQYIAKKINPQAILCVYAYYIAPECDVTQMTIDLLNQEYQGLINLD